MNRAEEVARRPIDVPVARPLLARIFRDVERGATPAAYTVFDWPVPSVPSERLLTAETTGEALLWAPSADEEVSGLGAAFTLHAEGPERFASIERQARAVWPMLGASVPGSEAPAISFFGGFAFRVRGAEGSPWRGFGDARFIVPELAYLRRGQQAWLRLIAPRAALESGPARARIESRVRRAVGSLFEPAEVEPAAREVERSERSEQAWADLVRAIQEEIASGRAQKIVAARRLSLRLDRPMSLAAVQARLRDDASESTRFAFRVNASTFLGATPEQLIEKRGLDLWTEAVAGSISADDSTAEHRLLASAKDIGEHEFVVGEILRLLGPLTSELRPAPAREIHRLRTVLHLRTPIRGKLERRTHILELVARLHPTPAVAGLPTHAAVDFISRHEPDERGWYAGPVGFFDAAGDGRFVVALRSGVLCGAQADLFAGAGVVKDSNAPSEFAETRWKLAALLGALGVSA